MKLKFTAFFIVLSCILLISSSHVDDKIDAYKQPIEESYLKAKINGEAVFIDAQEYFNTFYGELPDGRWYLGLTASLPNENAFGSQISMIVHVWQLQRIKTGSYHNGRWEEMGMFGNLYIGVQLGYQNIAYGMTVFGTDINKPEASLNIIELTNEHIIATFSGTIYEPVNRSPLVITEGELFINRTD